MSEDLRPALSEEEWIQYAGDLSITAEWAADKRPYGPDRRYTIERKRHAVAAIALYDQPFGFTHEDAMIVGNQAHFYEHRGFVGDAEIGAKLRLLEAKITALLPPESAEEVMEKLAE